MGFLYFKKKSVVEVGDNWQEPAWKSQGKRFVAKNTPRLDLCLGKPVGSHSLSGAAPT